MTKASIQPKSAVAFGTMVSLWFRRSLPLLFMVANFGSSKAALSESPNPLSLEDALQLARQRNGNLRAAVFNFKASQSRVRQAAGAFLPTLTPSFRYETGSTNLQTGPFKGRTNDQATTTDLSAGWRLLDSGERHFTLAGARSEARAQELLALQTLRNVLFNVHQQFYDALRAQELLKVEEAQLKRTETILDATKVRVENGSAARKDILQATADALNAKSSVLGGRNRVATSQATLKATIGWDNPQQSPELQKTAEPKLVPLAETLDQALASGVQNRADLQAERNRLEEQRSNVRLAEIAAGVSFFLDASAGKRFSPDVLDRNGLVLFATIPLFDGNRAREAVRSSKYVYESDKAILEQDERTARSEIESAYKEYAFNQDRLVASKAALDAAQLNYTAASESQLAGAANLIEVLTAQVSLVTAESNYVEALYDAQISEVRLQLAMGMPIRGETQ